MLLDPQQIIIEKKLHELASALNNQASHGIVKKIISSDLFSQKNPELKSLYIYGGVGRGKSMLMKKFYNFPHKTSKIYFHFNAFMRLIHEALRDIRKEEKKFKDELVEAVKRVIKNHRLICFDEFQVVDIADAMLLSRIFSYLFSKKIIVVFTSNSHPRELYKHGLQREVFLQFVDKILLKNCEVLHLDSPTDYRGQYCQNLSKRYFISNAKNREMVKEIIESLTKGVKARACKIKVWGREVEVKRSFGVTHQALITPHQPLITPHPNPLPQGERESDRARIKLPLPLRERVGVRGNPTIAIFNFDELCRAELSASDYQAICKNFDLIFLLKIPKLTPEDANAARRLTLFIDEIYENKTALIVLAKTSAEKIYEHGHGSESFARTVSRFNEIKSDHYWQGSKILNGC